MAEILCFFGFVTEYVKQNQVVKTPNMQWATEIKLINVIWLIFLWSNNKILNIRNKNNSFNFISYSTFEHYHFCLQTSFKLFGYLANLSSREIWHHILIIIIKCIDWRRVKKLLILLRQFWCGCQIDLFLACNGSKIYLRFMG